MVPLLILLVLVVLCVVKGNSDSARIALAVQGKSNEIPAWINMVSLMQHRGLVNLFLFSYDAPIDETQCVSSSTVQVHCIHKPGTTWTSGRNFMATEIYKKEDALRHHFKYWMMSDHDEIVIDKCGKTSHCEKFAPRSLEFVACCFDGAVSTLVEPSVQFPIVHFYTLYIEDVCSKDFRAFLHFDCGDAVLYAYHRLAVPVIFPLIELLDHKSWWESQGMHFQLITACFPGYSVYSNSMCGYGSLYHSSYPRGRFPVESDKAIVQVYGKLGLVSDSMITLKTASLEQGPCANIPINGTTYTNLLEPLGQFSSTGWQNMTSFRKCMSALMPRFLKYVESDKDLSKIDGEIY